MAESTDIRDWARAHGKDIGDRGRIPADVRAEYEAAQVEDGFVPLPDPELVESPPFAPPPVIPSSTSSSANGSGADETTPKPGPKRKWYQRPPADDTPKRGEGKRKSAERPAGWFWKGLAYVVGPASPTGNVMRLQEPVAGMVLDDLIAGTIVDKMIQPFLKAGESGAEAWGLVGPPACVFVMERFPESWPVMMPLLEDAIEGWLAVAGPLMAKAKRRQAAALKALAEFPGHEDGTPTTVRDLIDEIFAGWEPTSNLSDQVVEEEAGAAA